MRALAGIDGCRGGWICVIERGASVTAAISGTLAPWLRTEQPHLVMVDMPIGLPDAGPRTCDRLARQALGPARASSIFSAPVRGALGLPCYATTCAAHRAIDGRAISKQTWFLMPKIAELDALLQADPAWRAVLHEGHPEVSFATWNGGMPLAHAKRKAEGRAFRRALVDGCWPGAIDRMVGSLPPGACAMDDLLDACALLWTARRVAEGASLVLPWSRPTDSTGLFMTIQA